MEESRARHCELKKPTFSILVPVYNSRHYLNECVASVINQTFEDFELLLLDDGSNDGSEVICDKYSKMDYRIHAFHKENSGPLATREFGIKNANGQYVLFLDSDDLLVPDALETISFTFRSANVDLIIFGYETFSDKGIVYQTPEMEMTLIKNRHDLYSIVYFNSSYNALWRKAFKRDIYLDISYKEYYKYSIAEDLLQSIQLYKNTNSTLLIRDRLYRYRSNDQSLTHRMVQMGKIPDFKINQLVYETIKHEEVFSDEELENYKQYCIAEFVNIVKKFSTARVPMLDRVIALKTMSNTSYYKDYLRNIKPIRIRTRIAMILYNLRLYHLTIWLMQK